MNSSQPRQSNGSGGSVGPASCNVAQVCDPASRIAFPEVSAKYLGLPGWTRNGPFVADRTAGVEVIAVCSTLSRVEGLYCRVRAAGSTWAAGGGNSKGATFSTGRG